MRTSVGRWTSRGSRPGRICIAGAVEAELRAGVERLPDGRRKRVLGRNLGLHLAPVFCGRVFPFGRGATRFCAEFVAARARAGRPAALADAFIAATPRGHGAALLATRKTEDFEGCGAALVDPWDDGAGQGGS